MDQVHVEAPAASPQAASVEREFYSDFPLVLNYVGRLVDDIDGAVSITCAAFRQVGDSLRHRPTREGLRRGDEIRAATAINPPAQKPRRWVRLHPVTPIRHASLPQSEARQV